MDYGWWKYLPPIHPEAPSDFDLCGGCGISRDMHPFGADCPGGDWRQIGYVGDYGDPRPPEFNGERYRDPQERTTPSGEYIWWIPAEDEPPSDGMAGGADVRNHPDPDAGPGGAAVTPMVEELQSLTMASTQ